MLTSFSAQADYVKRDILALYFGSETQELTEHAIHRYLELPLNHLGYHVRYWDIEKGFPSEQDMKPIHGIITWFQGKKFEDPLLYAAWLVKQLNNQKRYVFFGVSNLVENAKGDLTPISKVNEVFNLLGMKRRDEWVNKHDVTSYSPLSAFAEKFERQVAQEKKGFYAQRATHPQAEIWLRGRYNGGKSSDLVFTTPKGGCALEGHFLFIPGDSQEDEEEALYAYATQWRIDPLRFLRTALGGDGPIPDMTTACAKRLAFVHVDGDGWNNLLEGNKKGVTAAEAILENILRTRKNMRFTVAPIASDLDPSWGGTRKAQNLLTEIAALPHVEIASHTYSHPQNWGFYTEKRTLDEEKKQEDAPRGNLAKPFDLENEVQGALTEISKYIPAEKKIKLYLWSGDCLPYEAVFEQLNVAGLLNLNGGSNRFDTEFPSLTGISPFYRQVGKHIQVYSAGNNEESYTYGWSDRFFGLKYFTKTLRNTEYPYRIKPMNLYFNMFTGQKYASIQAAYQVLNYMKTQEVFWCFASEYAARVSSFPAVKIENLGILHWRILARGALNTFRFDLATEKTVDMTKSKGVIGMRHLQGSLYVTTDPDFESPEIKLIENEKLYPLPIAVPYLLDSTWEISGVSGKNKELSCDVKGLGQGKMRWMMPLPGKYKVSFGEKELGIKDFGGNNIIEIELNSNELVKRRFHMTLITPDNSGEF